MEIKKLPISEPAIFTYKKRENAKKNALRYDWAAKEVEEVKSIADKYADNIDTIYDRLIPEGLPRYYHIGHKYDPKKFFCRYCDCNVGLEYGSYAWITDMTERPWKIQCPSCKRLFPSNDFGSFYKLGLSESGSWDYERALQKHHELFVCKDGENCTCKRPTAVRGTPEWYGYYGYGVKGGYLTNDLYPEMDEKLGTTCWGVDDSRGYMQPYIDNPELPGYNPNYYADENGLAWYDNGGVKGPVKYTYVAYYLHGGLWYDGESFGKKAITALTKAYVYTGEAKYGRAGAIFMDRIADIYPGFEWYQWHTFRGDDFRGGILDPVWETGLTRAFAEACDAFKPAFSDPFVIDYLSKKAARYETNEDGSYARNADTSLKAVNLKDTPEAIWENIVNNLLLRIFENVRTGRIWGNFGMHQNTLTAVALTINRMPETGMILDWIMEPGKGYNTGEFKGYIKGGAVMQHLIDQVDRDGNGNENAPGYNSLWCYNIIGMADKLAGYELYPKADLFRNVKFSVMFFAQARLTLGGYYGTQTGDSGGCASSGIVMNVGAALIAFKHTGDRELARAIHMANTNPATKSVMYEIRGSILDDDPEQISRDIERIVKEDGEYTLGSDMMTGYGFAALRAGTSSGSIEDGTYRNTHRDFAMYFGSNIGHGHFDTLNLFVSAYGLNVAPDLGYPEQTGYQPNRMEWVHSTISHNTVLVNEKAQSSSGSLVGTSYHFDDSDRVKLMDIGADYLYPEANDYRRSVIMVDVDGDISYGVDFFHINGGYDHMYSFHSQSDEASAVSGLDGLCKIPMRTDENGNLYGVYAGADVKYGPDPGGIKTPKYPNGYTWLKNVRTYNKTENSIAVEFNVKDWNKAMKFKRDLNLRLTMLTDKPLDEVTFARALPPQTVSNTNLGEIDYMLARHKSADGSDIDTTFTTVYETYEKGSKY
nr:heparinase II/III family protein [Clostridia bacterium]